MAIKNFLYKIGTKGAKKAEKDLKGVDSATKSMVKSAIALAGAYLSARGLVNAVKASVQAFMVQETAERRLEVALGRNIDALKVYASELQQVTLFGDETILSAQAMLAAFVKDEEALRLATKATLDLAAAKGFDLVTAADLVGKTLGCWCFPKKSHGNVLIKLLEQI